MNSPQRQCLIASLAATGSRPVSSVNAPYAFKALQLQTMIQVMWTAPAVWMQDTAYQLWKPRACGQVKFVPHSMQPLLPVLQHVLIPDTDALPPALTKTVLPGHLHAASSSADCSIGCRCAGLQDASCSCRPVSSPQLVAMQHRQLMQQQDCHAWSTDPLHTRQLVAACTYAHDLLGC